MPADARKTGIDMGNLKDLKPLAKQINSATDEFQQTLEFIQQELNSLALGVEAWLGSDALSHCVTSNWMEVHGHVKRVVYSDETEDEQVVYHRSVEEQELGYARFGDSWALMVRTVSWSEEKQGTTWGMEDGEEFSELDRKPLLRSARDIRVKAVDLIPKLIDALRDEASKVIEAVTKAKQIAESLK